MLDAFKIKPFDLEPIFASWTDGPRFTGNPKKDPPVDEWLKDIKEGCVQRKVPQEYWHKVGRHFMEPKAKARMDELKKVMAKVHGGNYRWTWKKFKIAMRNMGWDIDASETETIRVQTKPSGIFWFTKNKTEEPEAIEEVIETKDIKGHQRPSLSSVRSDSLWLMRKNSKNAGESHRPIPRKAKTTDSSFWGTKKEESSKDEVSKEVVPVTPLPRKAETDVILPSKGDVPIGSDPEETVTTIAHAPKWLLNACNALDFLTTEHPKAMTTLSAVLITVGTLPATLVAAGVGGPVGAVLASHAAQAVSAVAIGVGNLLKAQTNGQVQATNAPATSTVR